MKKKIVIALSIVIILLIIVAMIQSCDHEEAAYLFPKEATVTYEALISAPYVTENSWDYADLWTIQCNGNYLDPTLSENDIHDEIAVGLADVLNNEALHAYLPEENLKKHNAHVNDLLNVNIEEIPLYIQIAAGSSLQIQEGDIKPTVITIYSFDSERCYLTIGYRIEPEPKTEKYIYYTDDSTVVNALFTYADTIIQNHA